MDAENCKLACGLVSKGYIEQGAQALAKRHRLVKALLSQRRLPADGWDDATIEMFIQVLRYDPYLEKSHHHVPVDRKCARICVSGVGALIHRAIGSAPIGRLSMCALYYTPSTFMSRSNVKRKP